MTRENIRLQTQILIKAEKGVIILEKNKYPNETLRILCERASLRNFSEKKIPQDVLNDILQAGIQAPSGGNIQPFSIIKIENLETNNKLAKLCGGQNFIAKAPVNLLFCIDWHRFERWAELENAPFTATSSFRHFWISFQDTIISAQNICTAADSLGLGSVYVGTVLECFLELRDMFTLPKGVFPVVLLSLGYPQTNPPMKKKLDISAIVHDEKYSEMNDDKFLEILNEKYQGRQFEIKDNRLETIWNVCNDVHGEEFANLCIEKIKKNGFINAIQHYFGLHYRANILPERNEEFVRITKEFGFNWFKNFTSSNK